MNDQLIKEIDGITLSHMEIPIDPEDILMKADGLAGKKLALYLVQRFFSTIKQSIEEQGGSSRQLDIRALAYSKWYAMRRISELPDVVENATAWLIKDASEKGWFNDLPGEYQTLGEFLSTIYEDLPEDSSAYYNWTYIAEHLLPLAKSIDVDPNLMLAATSNIGKIRAMVPAARMIEEKIRDGKMSPKKAKQDLTELLQGCANTDVSRSAFRKKLDEYRGIEREIRTLEGDIVPIGVDSHIICIPVYSKRELHMVENALRNRVQFRFRDISAIFTYVFGREKEDSSAWEKIRSIIGIRKE